MSKDSTLDPSTLTEVLQKEPNTTSRRAAGRQRHVWDKKWEERGAKESSILDLFQHKK